MDINGLPQGWTWECVLGRLEKYADLEAWARAHGAIRRARAIRSAAQLLRLVLAYVLSGLSFRGTAAWAEAAGEARLSDVALLKRLRACGPWLGELAATLSAAAHPAEPADESGRRIVAVDATAVASPGGQHKPYRLLHTAYDVGAQRFRTCLVTGREVAERLDIGAVEAGEIRLGDAVYGRYGDLAAVCGGGADYAVRLSARALKLETADGGIFNRAGVCRQAEADRAVCDAQVRVMGPKGTEPLTARAIVLPLSPDKAEAARRAMRKRARKNGHNLSKDALATASCIMLITSLEAEDWPAERVLALYRRRWQVELAFKRLKSLLDLERLRVFDPDLVNVWIHAVMIVALLIDLDRPAAETAGADSPRRGPDTGQSPSGAPSPLQHAA